MVLLNNDTFLTELTHMFQKSRTKGSVTVTMKKYDGRSKPIPREPSKEPPHGRDKFCLVRAIYKTKKIATVVSHKDINKFQIAYCSLLRSNIDGLKKLKKPKAKPKAT